MIELSTKEWHSGFFTPDDAEKPLLSDSELGGIALNDATQGLTAKTWFFTYADGSIKADSDIIVSVANVSEIAGTFDKLMRPVVAYVVNKNVSLRYPSGAEYLTISIPNASSPRLALDNKNYYYCPIEGKVVLFYIKELILACRTSDDNFSSEATLATLPTGVIKLGNVGLAHYNRLQVELVYKTQPGIGCGSGDWVINEPGGPPTWDIPVLTSFTWAQTLLDPAWLIQPCLATAWQQYPCGTLPAGGSNWPSEPPFDPTLPCP